MVDFDQSLAAALSISEKSAAMFSRAGVSTLRDLLLHLPIRYEDRSYITPISAMREGADVQIQAEILSAEVIERRKKILTITVADAQGNRCKLLFFHFYPNQIKQFTNGRWGLFYGKVSYDFHGQKQIIHPEINWLEDGEQPDLPDGLTPIYSTTQRLGQDRWRKAITQALEILRAAGFSDTDPLSEFALPSFLSALETLHFPSVDDETALTHAQNLARHRLRIEELCAHQLAIEAARLITREKPATVLPNHSDLIKHFLASLPFSLTDAQARVSAEIAADLAREKPMMRLVQGDVGSGKTIVALLACLQAVAAGKQAVFLTPTELLAEQHCNNIARLLNTLPVKPYLLVGKMSSAEKKRALMAIASGEAQIIIGTHAVFQEKVSYNDLALLVIDEQHRFGVHQRLQLQQKTQNGMTAHQLVLTATPIPRTLAMSHFGELDTSIIDCLPAGRKPVQTSVFPNQRRDEIIARVVNICAQGQQVYWVCPLIEESEKLECENAEAIASQLQSQLPELKIALLHGRMSGASRQEIMRAFAAGEVNLLVATTVIEVGVDVANATVMIIENAERFGLAQLHQLRGRIGRGSLQSYCLLLYQAPLGEISRQRLNIMRETNDGFKIAEADLHIRGAGELLGTKQTGEVGFYVAELPRDEEILFSVAEQVGKLQQRAPEFCQEILRRWKGDYEKYLQV